MTDLLLRFPNEAAAGKLGEALGCATFREGQWEFATTHKVAIAPIGEHYWQTGMTTESVFGPIPVMASDGKFWALARIVDGIPVPEELKPFLVERNEADEMQPKHRWA